MKTNYIIFSLFILLGINNLTAQVVTQPASVSTSQFLEQLFISGKTYSEITSEADAYFQTKYPTLTPFELCEGEHRDGAFVKYQRWAAFWANHLNEDGTLADFTEIARQGDDRSDREAICDDSNAEVSWNNINYTSNMGLQIDQGRTSSIAFHPTDENTYYVGAAWGGLWKTTDGGLTHTIVNDNLPLAAVSGIIIDPANPLNMVVTLSDIVWYGPTGIGVYVSNDGGETFTASGLTWGLNEGNRLYYIDQDPADANSMIVATSDGLFKSTDFFTTHELVQVGDFRSVKYSKSNPSIVHAGGDNGEYFRSTDGGETFTAMEDFGAGQVRIAVPVLGGSNNLVITSADNLNVSTDNGLSFTTKTLPESNMVIEFVFGSDNELTAGNFEVYRSNDFGDSFFPVSHWLGSDGLPFIHVDQRNVFVNPLLPYYVYYCNDGGVFRYNIVDNSFANLSTDLIITQYYDIAVSQSEELVLGGGSQDNGNIYRDAAGNWDDYAATGDGMGQDIDPNDAGTRYWSYQYGGFRRWQDGGNTNVAPPGENGNGAWETPFKIDPNNSDRILIGYATVYASNDNGDTWDAVGDPVIASGDLDQLAIAPSNSEKIYVTKGRILYVKSPGVDEWELQNTPAFADITDLEVDPQDENVVYICYNGYQDGKKVYRSDDAGENWTNITGSLPNLPIMSLELYYDQPGGIFVGTYGGVYYLDDITTDWRKYGCLPHTSVTDIEIQYNTSKIFIGTHGRGMFEAPINLYTAGISTNKDVAKTRLQLYPNPTINTVAIKGAVLNADEVQLTIIDATGRTIIAPYSTQANGELVIDCSGLVAGNYFITVIDADQNRHVFKLARL